jgi:hypothetical protein
MVRAEDPLARGHQVGVLVPGPRRVPRLAAPDGHLVAGVERAGVLRAKALLAGGKDPLSELTCGWIAAAVPEVGGDSPHPVAAGIQGRLGVREETGKVRPA